MAIDRSEWKPLSAGMRAAVDEYGAWSREHLAEGDAQNKPITSLYHYTNEVGLKGMIDSQTVWFTQFEHLNDPGELAYGMGVITALLNEIGAINVGLIDIFCKMMVDLFSNENMRSAFDFYFASFSRNGDDLGQWRGYGDNGRGYSVGFAPHLFHATEGVKANPLENYVVLPVVYGEAAGRSLIMPTIAKALELLGQVISTEAAAMRDSNVGMPLFDEMAKALIASELILYSMAIKHESYRH